MSLQEQLRELYRLDQQVRGLRGRLDAAERRQRAQRERLEQLQQQHQELANQLRHHRAEAHQLEQQAAGLDERIASLRERMNTARSNKEYSATLVEVNTLKGDKSKLEDQALEQMGEVEALQQRVTDVEQRVADQQKLVVSAEREVETAREEVGQRLDQATAERDTAAGQVPPAAKTVFDRLIHSYEGEALAEVHEQDRRRMEYTCEGCYMSLPIERVNALLSQPNQVVTCSNCGRILYMNQELRGAIQSK
ncbi:MAG: C4-type zinc ribbon domain-containing protein [Phycisphaeraceae bacterium]